MSWNPKQAMPVARPQYVDSYLEQLAGPNEQHEPEGGWDYQGLGMPYGEETDEDRPLYEREEGTSRAILNPGAWSRSGLTVKEMGDIGEAVVNRLGELPGIGTVIPASNDYNHPIDVIVEGQLGKFGCEIKANHSQAQERFKLGGKEDRLSKIKYCYENGLKPALIGVRLNFYTNLAYVFFREGMTDTWIGNNKMRHVGTFDFSDINPFKQSDPQVQAQAVENAHLPDQSQEEDEFSGVFPPLTSATDPDYLYVYYMSELHVEPYDHNLKIEKMFERLLDKFGVDMGNTMMDIDPTKTDAGKIWTNSDGIKEIEHTQLSEPSVRQWAEQAVKDWWRDHTKDDDEELADEWQSL